MSALWQGARKRAISATDMNEHSSRSHTIFTVNMELTPLDSEEADAARVIRRAKVRRGGGTGVGGLPEHTAR